MQENKEEHNHLVTTDASIIDCLVDLIDEHRPEEWKDLCLDVFVDGHDIYLKDFMAGESHNGKEANGTIYSIGRTDDLENPRENILIYFYSCISSIMNRVMYEDFRKEENDKKSGRDNDNKMGSAERGGGKDSDDAERPLSDARTSS